MGMTTGRRSKTTEATIFPSAPCAVEGGEEEEEEELKPRAHRSGRMLAGDRGSMVGV